MPALSQKSLAQLVHTAALSHLHVLQPKRRQGRQTFLGCLSQPLAHFPHLFLKHLTQPFLPCLHAAAAPAAANRRQFRRVSAAWESAAAATAAGGGGTEGRRCVGSCCGCRCYRCRLLWRQARGTLGPCKAPMAAGRARAPTSSHQEQDCCRKGKAHHRRVHGGSLDGKQALCGVGKTGARPAEGKERLRSGGKGMPPSSEGNTAFQSL